MGQVIYLAEDDEIESDMKAYRLAKASYEHGRGPFDLPWTDLDRREKLRLLKEADAALTATSPAPSSGQEGR